MNKPAQIIGCALLLQLGTAFHLRAASDRSDNWPSFRGPDGSGIAQADLPEHWDVAKSENVKWQCPIEGLGHGGPIVWDNRIFVVSAVNGDPQPVKTGIFGDIAPVENEKPFQWKLLCLDLGNGKQLWTRTAVQGPAKVKRHPKSSHANCTPATDGKHVVAFFGSEGLYCYDADGRLLWKNDLGLLDSGFYIVPDAQWEFASSPVIDGDRVVVECDVQKNSFVAAFSLEDGRELWRTPRDEVPTWSRSGCMSAPNAVMPKTESFPCSPRSKGEQGKRPRPDERSGTPAVSAAAATGMSRPSKTSAKMRCVGGRGMTVDPRSRPACSGRRVMSVRVAVFARNLRPRGDSLFSSFNSKWGICHRRGERRSYSTGKRRDHPSQRQSFEPALTGALTRSIDMYLDVAWP